MQIPVIVEEHAGTARQGEPVTVGIPLRRGQARDVAALGLIDEHGAPMPLQIEPLARWSDESLKWVLLDTLVDVQGGGRRHLTLTDEQVVTPASALVLEQDRESVRVDTGAFVVTFPREGDRMVAAIRRSDGALLLDERTGLRAQLRGAALERHPLRLTSVDVTAAGPLRATVESRGLLGDLEVVIRTSLWAGSALLRLDVTARNPRAARHAGGTWDLGDPGSVCFREFSLQASLPPDVEAPTLRWTTRAAGPLQEARAAHLEILQDSSGGDAWRSPNHLDANLNIPLTFRGYRVSGDVAGQRGDRAEPSLWLSAGERHLGATLREFWQCFPSSLEVSGRTLRWGLWPDRPAGLHELQGGEQKTLTAWLDAGAPRNLGWTQSPLIARSTPEHYVASKVFHNLIEWSRDENQSLLDLTAVVIDDERGLAARREIVDEYGWRNFGDAWADHENVGNDGPRPRISHYNNQYDGVYGMLAQFARSGDARWFRLADEMARHVADVDVYHTEQDRSAFSGGLFWHTDHYTDAATSTHRCYTRRCPAAKAGGYGGGPSAEHDYAGGLATHYFMTGWRPSRESALSLAEWVCRMDGPEDRGIFSLLPGPSGLATRTDDHTYHGPGRGAGNSLDTLLDALLLTDDERYLQKAEVLIRRVAHPDDDRDAFQLLTNPETRWSYVVFLLALLRYLDIKAERGELDERYAYGQATVIAYGRWMMDEETLSSAKKDLLEIWTESWPAQDLRKGLVLMEVARHLEDDAERALFRLRGRELFEAAQEELLEWETRTLTRPLFLVMRYAYHGSSLMQAQKPDLAPRVPAKNLGRPSGFVSWKGLPKIAIEKTRRLFGL